MRVILGLYLFQRDLRTPLDRPQYFVGFDEFDTSLSRITCIRRSDSVVLKPHWRSVYIVARPDFRSVTIPPSLTPLARLATVRSPAFRFPPSMIREFQASQQLVGVWADTPSGPAATASPTTIRIKCSLKTRGKRGLDGGSIDVCVTLGRCTHTGTTPTPTPTSSPDLHGGLTPSPGPGSGTGAHWAHVRFRHHGTTHAHDHIDDIDHDWVRGRVFALRAFEARHSCAHDHIELWPQLGGGGEGSGEGTPRRFDRAVEMPIPSLWLSAEQPKQCAAAALTFTVCPLNPSGDTLLLRRFSLSCREEAASSTSML